MYYNKIYHHHNLAQMFEKKCMSRKCNPKIIKKNILKRFLIKDKFDTGSKIIAEW